MEMEAGGFGATFLGKWVTAARLVSGMMFGSVTLLSEIDFLASTTLVQINRQK